VNPLRSARRSIAAKVLGTLSGFISRHDSIPLPPPRPTGPVAAAIRLSPLAPLAPSNELLAPYGLDGPLPEEALPAGIFRDADAWLPCVLEHDLGTDWFHASSYYPIYYRIYRRFHELRGRARLLELGVRTGYQAVIFAHATQGQGLYAGVDPNLYVADGLQRAASSLDALRRRNTGFEFVLVSGYSWSAEVKKTLAYSGPFDLIHVDGDHSLRGKLIDLELASRLVSPGGLVLVDDYDHHGIVREAVQRALAARWYAAYAHVPTLRGLAILSKAGSAA
jgi:hypothetical protein